MKYLSPKAAITGSGIVIIILVLAYLLKNCGGGGKAKIDAKTQRSIDSLAATRPAFQRTKDSIITVVVHDTVHAAVVYRTSIATGARAEASGRIADSLGSLARLHADSARLWRAAYESRTREVDTLKLAVVQLDSAYRYEHEARIALGTLYGADTIRRIAEERVNAGLIRDISRLQQPCKVVGFIPCPTRTVTMVVTAVAIVGTEALVRRGTKP